MWWSLGGQPVYMTHEHRNTTIICTQTQGWRASSCTKCLCSNTKYSYMLTTVTLTLVFTFMDTEEAVEVSNLCRVMQEISVCYLVMSAQTPNTCAYPYTHKHTCTHTDRHARTWNKYPSHFTSGCIKHTSDSKVSDLSRLPCLSVE